MKISKKWIIAGIIIACFLGICFQMVACFVQKENEKIEEYKVDTKQVGQIKYPQVYGISSSILEKKINRNLAYVFINAVDLEKCFTIDVPEVQLQNENLLSVETDLYYSSENGIVKIPIYQTIFIKTGELVHLNDIVEINEDFVQYLLDSSTAIRSVKNDDRDTMWNEEFDKEIRCYVKDTFTLDEILAYLKASNEDCTEKNYAIKPMFYLNHNEICVVHETEAITHFYFKIRLEIEDIENYLKIERW